jgi:multidrug efflux pump subunit AcrA (membrane-fusion protein)
MENRTRASWLIFTLGALCAGAIAAAVLVVGPASGSQRTATRTATVARGVVQSTVSGTGNLQSSSQLNLGFKTSGTVTDILVKQGQHVTPGQLLATLDPESAEVTLEQAKAALQSAEANLAREEETGGEVSSGASGGSAGASTSAGSTPATSASSTPSPAVPTPHASKSPAATTPSTTAAPQSEAKTTSTTSPATRAANLASARATVRSELLTVRGDEQSIEDTRLYAPESGTIVSLSGQVGEEVSATGTTRAAVGAGSSSSPAAGGASATGAGASSAARSGASSSTSSSSTSGASSSSFAVLSDLSSMELVVPLAESEIGSVRVGQPATVTVEALAGRKVAAHVSEVAILSTSNSGVVSYDVTFALDQSEAGLRPGMSATAEVVVEQAEGVNVPTAAISGGTVTVLSSGMQVRRRVVTGLAGNSSTIVLSGLQPGEVVVLPSATTSTGTGGTSLRSRGGGLGGGGAGGGFAAGAFLRGGG